ncbi:restriction endonuclease subunit S [Streptomyces populi]
MTFDLAIETASRRLPNTWRFEPFRRHAILVNETNANRSMPLLSLASTGVIQPRSEDGGLGKQAPSESTIERYWIARPGNLVVNPMWLTGGGIGVSHITGAVSPDYRVYRLGNDLHPNFVHHLLRSAPYRDQYRLYTRADTTFDRRVSKENFHPMPLLIPPLEEQRRIANFLDAETARIDALSASRDRQVTLLQERLMSSWSRAIDEDARDSAWAPIRRFITAITDGPFGSALTSSHYSDEGARVIRLGNLGRAEFRDRDPAFIPLGYFAELRRHEARPGDLIVAGLGDQNHPLGRACVVPDDIGPAMVKADCFRLRLDQRRVLHEYAAWALSSQRVADQVTLLARGSTRARINLEVARDIPVPVPSLERQRRSIAFLRDMRSSAHAVTARCHQQRALLAERRQALITAAVTGQFDVTTASGRNVTEGVSA